MCNNDFIPMAQTSGIMLKSPLLLLISIISFTLSGYGQIYDVVHRPNLLWYELNTPHFKVLYHDGYEEVARNSARLLESAYPKIQSITGGHLVRFPVIINGYNDLSNGYVTTLHFRMEVEASPIGGKILNPKTGGHLENLMAHELVHALQFSVKGGFGFTSMLYLFSPDMGRTMHGLNPHGIHEGLAVHAESHLVRSNGGRGNFAPFQNQFYSNFYSNSRWSLGQMLTPAGVSRPLDRHYIGGYEFSHWLLDTFGENTIKQSLHTFAKFPLLGYAPHIWYHTGKNPNKLKRMFHEDYADEYSSPINDIKYTPVPYNTFKHSNDPVLHNPKWLDDNRIIYFGRYYNHSPAFWIYDLNEKSNTKLFETNIEESFQYDLSPNKEKILHSRYQPHLFYDNTYISDVFEIQISSKRSTRVTRNQRSHTPIYHSDDGIYALQSFKNTHQLVEIQNGIAGIPFDIYPDNVVQVAQPQNSDLPGAILANRNGIQGIWFVDELKNLTSVRTRNPDISFRGGSIFDLNWSDDSRYLLFSSDQTGIMHIYEYDLLNDKLLRLTGGLYNTMEASYSPDNLKIAFIVQRNNGKELVVLDRVDLLNEPVNQTIWKNSFEDVQFNLRVGDEWITESLSWETQLYRNGANWVKPRSVLPISNPTGSDKGRTIGLSFQSSDVLRQNSYGVDLDFAHNRMFYDLNYLHTGFFPGINFKAKHIPYNPGNLIDGDNFTFRGEEREIGFGSRIRLNFDNRSRLNYLVISPEIVRRSSRISLLDSENPANNQTTHWFRSDRIRLYSSYAHRIKQTLRSAQPTNGILFFFQGDHDIDVSENIDSPFSGLKIGSYFYISPFSQLNQSMRIGITSINQNRPGYNTLNLIHEGFNQDNYKLIEKDFFIFSSRYTIPITHPDRGGFLLPGYIERIYGVVFTETLSNTKLSKSDTIIGLGLRSRFKLFYNATFDLGIGYAIHTNKNLSKTYVIDF
jgi:hypothetical protein